MRHAILLLAALILGTTGAAASTYIALQDLPQVSDPAEPCLIQATDLAGGATRIEYAVAGFTLDPITIAGGAYQHVTLGEENLRREAGAPELPRVRRSVIIPDDARMELRVIASHFQEFTGVDVAPSKGNLLRTVDPASVPYTFGETYATDAWFPPELAVAEEPYILRDHRGLVVELNLFQYNPARRVLRVYDEVVLELVPVGPGATNVLDRALAPEGLDPQFDKLYRGHFLNYGSDDEIPAGGRYAAVGEGGGLLIISPDDGLALLQPLYEWKLQKGIPTKLVGLSETGSTKEQIKAYITAEYNATGISYVLLIGDAPDLPTYIYGGGGSDPTYALVAGGDNYPDLFVGRFSAGTVQDLETQVERTIHYERDVAAGEDWMQSGTGIASNQGPGHFGEYDNEHQDLIRQDLLAYGYDQVDQIYDPYGTAAQVSTALNAGRGIVNYTGHGYTTGWSSTNFNSSHVNALVNDNMLPFIQSVACVNGNFTGTTCFGEAWLRATHNGQPTGAIACYMSSVNQSWNPPMDAQDESIDLLVADEMRTVGGLWYNGSCLMIERNGYDGVSMYMTWILFGDPSAAVRTKTPEVMTVQHAGSVAPDATGYDVTVVGVPEALCALYADGVLYGSAHTAAGGTVTIPLVVAPPEGATLTLTVTAYNKVTWTGTVEVELAAQPAMLVEPEAFEIYLDLGQTQTEHLYITNTGMEGSVLEYSIRYTPQIDPAWLIVDPLRGELDKDQTADIQVTFDTQLISAGVYTGRIMVQGVGVGLVDVPVTLYAGDMAAVDERQVPIALRLQPARPNPAAGPLTIRFGLPESQNVHLGIYDLSGRLVRTLASGPREAGFHDLTWDGRDQTGHRVPGGVYLYRLDAGGERLGGKLMRLE